MRPATSALAAFVAANRFAAVFDLYTFALSGGTVLRFTSAAAALPQVIPAANFPGSPLNFAASGNRSFAVGPRFGRSKITTKIGTEPAELDIEVDASAADTIGSFTWQQAVDAGLFDGATVELDRFFAPPGQDGVAGPLSTSLGAIVWFYGLVADIESGRSKLTIKVKSMLNLLVQQQMPQRLFQASCNFNFGGAMCGYDRVNGKNALGASTGLGQQSVTAGAGSTVGQINAGFTPGPSSAYDQGTIIGTSGANNGISRTISQVTGGNIALRRALPLAPATGDTFNVLPGCDRTVPTCHGTFNNFARYGGMPYIPSPETAL
jgi:uncharacterized phage protein (TIGR02218 family)